MTDKREYRMRNVRITFDADAGGDAHAERHVELSWDELPAGSAESALLLDLWTRWYATWLAQARAGPGINLDFS